RRGRGLTDWQADLFEGLERATLRPSRFGLAGGPQGAGGRMMGRYLAGKRGKQGWLPLALLALAVTHLIAQRTVVSDKEVVSVLKDKCLQCHGDAVQMSKLDLRTRESILRGGEKGPAIVPGNAEGSRLYRRVAGLEQPAMPMAPMPALSPQEIAVLKNWIDQGARLGSQGQPATATKRADAGKTPAASGYGNDYKEKVI